MEEKMDNNHTSRVSLSKQASQPWTDPVTGEIYPGGPPNSVQQPINQYPAPQQIAQPYGVSVQQPYNASVQQSYNAPGQQPYAAPMPGQQPYYGAPIQQQPYYGAPMPQQIPERGGGYQNMGANMKFCKFCGGRIPMDAVVCTSCGRQVEQLQGMNQQPQQIIVNNANNNNNIIRTNTNVGMVHLGTPKNKWLAFFLCFFFGVFGVHRFYEGKTGSGLLYLFTVGLCGIGVFVDLIILLTKSDPYYV